MNNTESIKKNSDFKLVYKSGKYFVNKFLIMYVLENDKASNRIGISVSKKVGNSVIRHRVKRLIKESYRLSENMFNIGLDIIIVARVNSKEKSFNEINSALLHLAKLHKIIE